MEETVQVYVYDLSQGLARQMSPMLLGKQINGVWHTSIVVGGTEYYYGHGIQRSMAGMTPFGRPQEIINLGTTQVPNVVRVEYLQELASDNFRPERYNLLRHNCNTFSNEFATFLTGSGIPSHITNLPDEVMATPFGQMLMPYLELMETRLGSVQQSDAAINGIAPTAATPQAGAAAAVAAAVTDALSSAAASSSSVQQEATVAAAGEVSAAALKAPQPAEAQKSKAAAQAQTVAAVKARFEQQIRDTYLQLLAQGLTESEAMVKAAEKVATMVRS